MSRILIINSAKDFDQSKGTLNNTLTEVIRDHLTGLNHEVQITHVDNGYGIQEEIDKLLWADSIIYQMPVWWMGAPWILKKYFDDILNLGQGKLFKNDGRARHDPSKKYGSGGLLHDKTYMLSLTWNAPLEAFEDPNQFFEGKGADGLFFPFHKISEFLGMSPLPTFNCYDVVKAPDIESDINKLKIHLSSVF
ncbi:NAD(P)H-dependent oxidoreductase [Xenorhabdus sp. 12]|uniref:NAD(P)H-dependent oxidoreductase n=1 Tax=Xenorhabdus santafensis TaxID=2582833 RepID=A0ABU4SEV8_9GAMM|nr:NAD(P)H-dependent oxidoreductase [Xenorhabdus sp. 12]MDX7989320.1 NAD(P)H-dependent oxidoreductase [Xenorhabdus sp. 12]